MTNLLRKALGFVLLLSVLAPLTAQSPISAQSPLDGSACWQPGQLRISGAQMSWPVPPATIIDPGQFYTAALQTTAGTITIALDAASAPIATNNFICLALAGYYTGTDFHRIFANTLIQGGDPTATGLGNPGYTIPSDPTTGNYHAGSVAMANAAPNRNGSQFFIAATDLTGLIPNDYPVFGHVTSGMDAVLTISNGAVTPTASGEASKPVDPSVLLNVTITTGEPANAPAGPVLTTPVATMPAAPSDTAQTRPGSLPATAPPVTASLEPGCAGFDAYQTAFDDAYVDTAVENPDALAFLMSLQNDPSQSMFEQMTAAQANAMSVFYHALADAMAQIPPPPFAAEWHSVQIEIFRALGDFTAKIASQGLTLASMQAAPVLNDLVDRSDAAAASAAGSCAEFEAWASGEQAE